MNSARITRLSRRLLATLVGHVPSNAMRVSLYRLFPNYSFGARTRIGFGVVIDIDRMSCGDDVTIRRGTAFHGPISVTLASRTFIGRFNTFECGDSAADPSNARMQYARALTTGENSLINESHLFDILGRIEIGKGSWIAGFGSQFITHGASVMNRDIRIGEMSFLGSAVRFAPGAAVGNRVMVGMGAVVTKELKDDDVVIGGLPARVIRTRDAGDTYRFEKGWQ